MTLLPHIEKETGPNVQASVIWLHGLGANGHDFEPIVPELKLPAELCIRFIFPHAPHMPVTINGGMHMPAWYDILDMSIDRKVDETQLLASANEISKLIDREIERGIDSHCIFVLGFSQGGAVALQTALSYPKPLGGLGALSTYFATANSIQIAEANRSIPIQVFHGIYDPVVPEALGQKIISQLATHNLEAKYKTYPMQHSVCQEQVSDISVWLQSLLK